MKTITKNYTIKKKTIIDVLDDIDLFIDSVELAMAERPNIEYKYNIGIEPIEEKDMKWLIDLKLVRNERV